MEKNLICTSCEHQYTPCTEALRRIQGVAKDFITLSENKNLCAEALRTGKSIVAEEASILPEDSVCSNLVQQLSLAISEFTANRE